ncbi:MAG: DUF4258 domain-containing protein [Candidatus Firestonebacteria bacterium]|nr:DUF4258 domain-containing protein [Candidatus Firestonebacteria bacterium]
MLDIEKIRRLIANGKYEYSKHAERERELDEIYSWELEEALSNSEIIENYSDDPRGKSCLILGFSGSKPIHAVCTLKTEPEELFLITLYDPSKRPDKWLENYKKRR